MRIVAPRAFPKRDATDTPRFASAPLPQWLRDWIDQKVDFALLECGHYVDRNARGPIICGDKADCGQCDGFRKVIRPASLTERFGIVMTDHKEPPF